jgi:hypothetical protein
MLHSANRLTGFTSAAKRRIYKENVIIEYINISWLLYKMQLITRSRIFPQKLIVLQLVKKYPTYYGIMPFVRSPE